MQYFRYKSPTYYHTKGTSPAIHSAASRRRSPKGTKPAVADRGRLSHPHTHRQKPCSDRQVAHSIGHITSPLVMLIARYISPKEPDPIFRTNLYLPPTINSALEPLLLAMIQNSYGRHRVQGMALKPDEEGADRAAQVLEGLLTCPVCSRSPHAASSRCVSLPDPEAPACCVVSPPCITAAAPPLLPQAAILCSLLPAHPSALTPSPQNALLRAALHPGYEGRRVRRHLTLRPHSDCAPPLVGG